MEFLKLYFMDYAITVVPIFPPVTTSTQCPQSLRQSLHHCSCPWIICVSSSAPPFPILYFTSPWLFCDYLFVLLNPLHSSPILPHHLPSGNYQDALCIHDSVTVLICLVCFLDSVVDRYVFIALLFLIVLIFFLNKSV